MSIYLITFLLSCIFIKIASNYKLNKDRHSKTLYIFFSFIAILIPSLLAGIRDFSIGTDVKTYILPFFNRSIKSSSLSMILKISELEKIFVIIAYYVIKIFKNINVLLFLIEFIIILLVYTTLQRHSEIICVYLSMMMFYLIFFNATLNLIRQFLAISIILWSTKFIESKNFIKYIISVIIAAGIHSSAIVTIFFYPLYQIFKDRKNLKIEILSIAAIILLMITYNKIVYFSVYTLNLLPTKYYEVYALSLEDFDFLEVENTFRLLFLFLIFLNYSRISKKFDGNSAYIYILILDILILQLGNFSRVLYRISLYTEIFILIIVPQFLRVNRVTKDFNSKIYTIFILSICFLYWYYIYILNNSSETYPYVSILFK